MIEKEIQIKTLLYGDPFCLACETLGVQDMRHHSYSEVFTVTFEEVYDYVSVRGLPESGTSFIHEGFHYFKADGRWHTFFRERGNIYDKRCFDDEEAGKRYILRTLLQLKGTGLYWG